MNLIPFIPLIGFLFVPLLYTAQSRRERWIYSALIGISLLLTVGGPALLSWALRDGLGPDAVESTGIVAWTRFWELPMQIFAASGVVVMASAIFAFRRSARRER